MTKREIVERVLAGERPGYVPWNLGFTLEAAAKLREHYGTADLEPMLQNHLLEAGEGNGFYEPLGGNRYRDFFGVIWDRTVDRDLGRVENCILPEATLRGYEFPDPQDPRFFAEVQAKIDRFPDRYRVWPIAFSLYERAWTLRGMENLLMDFYVNPDFVRELLGRIADFNIAQIRQAFQFDIDAVLFGDDWGQQIGLQMGPGLWREFLKPQLKRMYDLVHQLGGKVMIHSCGDVQEVLPDLIEIGVNCFNPFQPEVMEVATVLGRYRPRLAFQGGLSTQRTLPYGSVEEVKQETQRLLQLGQDGSYIFAPAHAVEGDVPVENMLAFIEIIQGQENFRF